MGGIRAVRRLSAGIALRHRTKAPFVRTGLVRLCLVLVATSGLGSSDAQAGMPTAALSSALGMCKMIATAKTADQVRDFMHGTDAITESVLKDLAVVNAKLKFARADTAAAKQRLAKLKAAADAKIASGGVVAADAQNRIDDAALNARNALADELRLQSEADEDANQLTVLTFAGPTVTACAD